MAQMKVFRTTTEYSPGAFSAKDAHLVQDVKHEDSISLATCVVSGNISSKKDITIVDSSIEVRKGTSDSVVHSTNGHITLSHSNVCNVLSEATFPTIERDTIISGVLTAPISPGKEVRITDSKISWVDILSVPGLQRLVLDNTCVEEEVVFLGKRGVVSLVNGSSIGGSVRGGFIQYRT